MSGDVWRVEPFEAQDALLFGAATLVILPLAPNRAVDPFNVLNPRTLWTLVVLVMAISAAVSASDSLPT